AGKDIDVSGWSDFLDAHLERGADGAFVKENCSYVDQTNDSNAFFGLALGVRLVGIVKIPGVDRHALRRIGDGERACFEGGQ
ncbi:hypothetical protein ACCS72_38300, partial [Rhizobium ruizarguesonis]